MLTNTVAIPSRKTPKWEQIGEVNLSSKQAFEKLGLGKVPVGIMPDDVLIKSDEERLTILDKLNKIALANDGHQTRYYIWGHSLHFSKTVKEHFTRTIDDTVQNYCDLFIQRATDYLNGLGFDVLPLVDPLTGQTYPAGVFRLFQNTTQNSIMHIDDFVRAGSSKPDFNVPAILEGRLYYQVSFNILLDDGGHQADPVYTYNRFYHPSDEEVYQGGYRMPLELVEGKVAEYKYQPKVGETYVIQSTSYHDIRGGSLDTNRITWSMFSVYVPSLNAFLFFS